VRLAFCITELNVGGAERIMCELAIRLCARGHSVVVYSLQSCPVGVSCVSYLESAGIPVKFLDIRNVFSSISGLNRLRKLLKEQSPDIFISFLFHANVIGRIAAYLAGIKHIVSCIRVAERSARWHLFLDRWTSKITEKYICVSNSVAEFSKTIGGLPENKIFVICNGVIIPPLVQSDISSDEFENKTFENKILENKIFENKTNNKTNNKIIFVGRLDYQKGVDWFIQTVPSWLNELKNWELIIVGDGNLRNELKNQIDNFSIGNSVKERIKIMGWREDAIDLIAESKILLLTSRWEGMPNVLLQAMSYAKPVVATNVEGVAELLGDYGEQQMCTFGDTQLFAKKILNIAQNNELAQKLGLENRKRVIENFSIDKMVQQYEQLLLAINS
jgi:glycosyltransferase involved in cell wall biosynthesis